jgi:hypothetical protein
MEYEFGYKYVIPTGLFYFDCNACGHIAKTPKSTGISLWIGNKTKKCWCFKGHQIPYIKKALPCYRNQHQTAYVEKNGKS